MANVRTQIRSFAKTTLDAALASVDYDVFEHKIFAINATSKAIVDMGFQQVTFAEPEVMDYRSVGIGAFFIRITRTDNESAMFDALEADEVLVAEAMHAADWSSLLEDKPIFRGVLYSDSGEGQSATASITLQYDLEYRINDADHETIIS